MAKKVRRYRVSWTTYNCNMARSLTLHASNKREAKKLIADRYPAKSGKYKVEVLK